MNEQLPLAFAKRLLIFFEKEHLPASQFTSKKLKSFLDVFIQDKILKPIQTGKRQTKVVCPSLELLEKYLKNNYHINDLRAYVGIDSNTTRSEAAQIASDTKLTNKKVFKGLWFNAFQEVSAILEGELISLKPPKGSVLYFLAYDQLQLDKDIIIVGMENAENFTDVHLQQHLFEKNKCYLFTRRDTKNHKKLIDWLQSISNPYLHFGDLDIAGMAIFENEFYKYLEQRATFYLPPNIDKLIEEKGNSNKFDTQYHQLKTVKGLTYETKILLKIIKRHQKILEQEFFILNTIEI